MQFLNVLHIALFGIHMYLLHLSQMHIAIRLSLSHIMINKLLT